MRHKLKGGHAYGYVCNDNQDKVLLSVSMITGDAIDAILSGCKIGR